MENVKAYCPFGPKLAGPTTTGPATWAGSPLKSRNRGAMLPGSTGDGGYRLWRLLAAKWHGDDDQGRTAVWESNLG
jgi:hypothetical protein